jgi:hypothetical protein
MLQDGAPPEQSERALVIGLLDAFQAAERAGAEAMGRWIGACRDPRLRGGLALLRARDVRHAALAAERVRALGGEPGGRISRELAGLCGVIGHPEVSDRSKLGMLLARFPHEAPSPLADLARRIHDAETRAMLETMVDDEQAGVAWLRAMRDALDREGA